MSNSQLNPADDLIEALARIEHEQWIHWSQAVAAVVPDMVRMNWQRSWVGYDGLTDELKEADRIWARKVMMLLRQRRLIQ